MRIRYPLRLAGALLALVAAGVFVSCEVTFTWTNTLTGKVVDARIDPDDGEAGIASVTITLLDGDGATVATTTSGDTGTFSFADLSAGTYTITGAKTGYAFISKNAIVAGNDLAIDGGALVGFASGGSDISIVAVWSDAFLDVDAYLTYPIVDNYTAGNNPVMDDPYQVSAANSDAGFFADTATDRETVAWNKPTGHVKSSTVGTDEFDPVGGSADIPAIKLDRDETEGSGPETITIKSPPITALNLNATTTPTTANGLPDGDTYSWVGVMQYYVDSYGTPSLSTEGEAGGAEVEVYIIQGAEVKGRFVVPDYITIETAAVLRINMFVLSDGATPFYQFVPDIRIADYSGIKALSGGPLVLRGTAR